MAPRAPRAPRLPRLPSPTFLALEGKKPLNISVGTRTATRITEVTSRIFFLKINPIRRAARLPIPKTTVEAALPNPVRIPLLALVPLMTPVGRDPEI